jgi:chromosome segregation ATPase
MPDFDELLQDLKQARDELRLQIHLASKEAKEEWDELEDKMEDFSAKAKKFSEDAKLKETGEGLGEALGKVGHELKKGYERLRKAMND